MVSRKPLVLATSSASLSARLMLSFVESSIRVLVSSIASVAPTAKSWWRVLICPVDLSSLTSFQTARAVKLFRDLVDQADGIKEVPGLMGITSRVETYRLLRGVSLRKGPDKYE